MPQPNATSPFEIVYTAIKTAIETEFAADGIVVQPDELHEALGLNAVAVGVAPVRDGPMSGAYVVLETVVHIQWFDYWEKQVDPSQQVDPRLIARKAERVRRALKTASTALGNEVWFFNVEGTEYPRDPTGNKTRFVMTVSAQGTNAQLVETIG